MNKSTFIALSCALAFIQEASTATGARARIYSCSHITKQPHCLNINKDLHGGTKAKPSKEAALNVIQAIGLNGIEGKISDKQRATITKNIIHLQRKYIDQ